LNTPYHNKALSAGTILREWRLEEVLGVGGFGIVYRGKGVYFGEDVAIKEYFPGGISDRIDGVTVAPTDSSSENVYRLGRQKFLEEAKLLWNLSQPERHPNIVSVRSLFEIHGTAYMVMDFEKGVSLSQMLRDGKRFSEQELLAIIRPIAEGLERAHKVGVFHRDIKPANILMSPQGNPVLIDFGSARFESGDATSTKVTFYTPPYAALEQYVKSYPQGPWTDVYALGVVLYQCIAGEKPPDALERMHGGNGPFLTGRDWPGFSEAFIHAVDAALTVRPLERPATLSAWLDLFDPGRPLMEKPPLVAANTPGPPKVEPITFSSPPPVVTSGAKSIAKRGGKFALMALGSAAVFALLAAGGRVASHWHKAGPTTPDVAFAVAKTSDNGQTLTAKLDALTEAARTAGRKDSELAAIADIKARLAGLVIAKADPAQMTSAAQKLAQSEADILFRTEKRLWRDVESPPTDTGSQDLVAKLTEAKGDLDAKLSSMPTEDAGQIIDGLRLSLMSFARFQDAYAAAAPAYVTARRKSFDALHAATRSVCEQVASLANVEEPWFLASSSRKNAYKLRQDNAAQAKALEVKLDELAGAVASSGDLRQLTAAVGEATAARKTATSLYTVSNSAQL